MRALKLFCLLAVVCSIGAAAEKSPNIVVILSDDFGFGSLGCNGAPGALKTPNLDRLAKEGRRFTHAYAPGSVCSPTRYGLMTGRYYWRTSIKDGEEKKRKKQAAQEDELFNLRDDPSEGKNVASANRVLAAKLKQRLQEARDRGFTRPGAN